MTADEFVKVIRKGAEKLRVDEIVVNTGVQQFHGKGLLHIEPETISIHMTVNKGEVVPDSKTGIFTKRDYLQLSGIIEDRLQFKCDHVGPRGWSSKSWPGNLTKCKFDLHPIDLIPFGLDAMSRKERDRLLKQGNDVTPVAEELGPVQTADFSFYVTLFEYPWIGRHCDPEEKVEINGCEVRFEKEDEKSDLRVSIHSGENYTGGAEESDWRKFYSLMKALAFVHGVNAWPYRVEYWREGKKLKDRVTAIRKLSRTAHSPFSVRLFYNALEGSIKWNIFDPLQRAAAFFEMNSKLSKEVSEILFLFREADEGVHSEITTIALCTLLENLVQLVFRELALKNKGQTLCNIDVFEQAKREVVGYLRNKAESDTEKYQRLLNIVGSAQQFTIEQIFRAVTDHFGLKWEGDMEIIFKTWKNARNPIVHNKSRADLPEEDLKQATVNESRIGGAINIILLKLLGYSGYMRSSTFEDQYRKV